MRAVVLLLSCVAVCGACTSREVTREARLFVEVADDQGRALAGVSIDMDGTSIATTDVAGHARATVQGGHRSRIQIGARCPLTFRESAPRTIALARREQASAAHHLRMVCAPKLRTLAVVVRAPGAEGLTLRADGVPLTQVRPDGTAHAVLQRAPDSNLRLTLDTTEAPKVVPQFPVREVHVSDRDDIIVFDQTLVARATPVKRRARVAAPVTPARHVPYAIGRSD